MTSGTFATSAASSRSSAAVSSTGVPVGMSTTTWNSDLLSNGSIFITTAFIGTSSTDSRIATAMAAHSFQRLRLPRSAFRNGVITRWKNDARRPASLSPDDGALCAAGSRRSASHGVTVNAIASDSSMPIDELIGIGAMYGPIRPLTKAIGSSAAMTVSVARMVGPPTSSTAPGMTEASGAWSIVERRWMFWLRPAASAALTSAVPTSACTETFIAPPKATR